MKYQFIETLNSLPDKTPTGLFGFSFLSWQGSSLTFQDSQWLVFIIYGLLFFTLLSIFLFKTQMRNYYLNNYRRVSINLQGFGFFIILLSIFRIIVLVIGGYPNLWELIPFHFCRMFILLIALSLLFKRFELIKYFGALAIGGGFIGLIISDLGNSEYWAKFGGMDIGYDNYIFWDYFIIHCSSVAISVYLFTIVKPKIYKSTIIYSMITMIVFTVLIFIANLLLSNVPDQRWRPNWFYIGVPELNGIAHYLRPLIGPLADYPTILFTFIFIGIAVYLIIILIYLNSDKVNIILRDNKTNKIIFKFEKVPSENLMHFSDGPFKYRKDYLL